MVEGGLTWYVIFFLRICFTGAFDLNDPLLVSQKLVGFVSFFYFFYFLFLNLKFHLFFNYLLPLHCCCILNS